jgi:hypothetical protein
MRPEEPERLPTSIGGLFGSALGLYARRIALYAALAGIALAVQFVAGVVLPHTEGSGQALAVIVDAYLVAAVTIGVAGDVERNDAGWRAVLAAASERWGVVAIAGFVYFVAVYVLVRGVYGTPEETAYGLLIPPIITFWGAVSLAQVVAAIEPAKSRLMLPLISLGKALSVALRRANLGRLILLSVILTIPTLLQSTLYGALSERHVRDAFFWANVPFDAILGGPLQAISTLFYLDFVRRAARR